MTRVWLSMTCGLLLGVGVAFAPATAEACDSDGCCKHCVRGKACGDSCISWGKDCHKPRGCACDGPAR